MKLKKKIPLIDQHDRNGFWGGKFGGSFIPETLKNPVEDLTWEFSKLRNNKKFLKKRDYYFKNYIGSPTSFVKLENLSSHLGGAQIWAKVVSEANGGAHKIYNATVHALICIFNSLEICAVLHPQIFTNIFGPTVLPTHICVVSQFDTQYLIHSLTASTKV